MKLIRAEFTNFRILRDLVLDFPTDTDRKLTVIRARERVRQDNHPEWTPVGALW